MMRRVRIGLVGLLGVLVCAPAWARPQLRAQLQEDVVVGWWLVPVYAVDRAGAPVLDLTAEDLEVRLGGTPVTPFSLIRKQFQPAEARLEALPLQVPPQKKMVFLVFDAAFSPYHLLARARTIADTVIAHSDGNSQYVLLSIEPDIGLKYIAGPTRDPDEVSRSLKRFLAGKKQDYLLESANSEPSEPQNVNSPGDILSPNSNQGARTGISFFGTRDMAALNRDIGNRTDALDRQRLVSSYTSSLLTLNLVLGQFREFSKVVYLYSCGVTEGALPSRAGPALSAPGRASGRPAFPSADTAAYDSLTMIGRRLNTSGAILFLVNPSGTGGDGRIRASGERSLRILAGESGGRYFEGAKKKISRQVNGLEGGYYEISFRDGPEYEGDDLDLEVRCRRADVEILTVNKIGRKNEFSAMTDLEKEVLVLNILNKGPFALAYPKVRFVPADDVFADGGWLVCRMPLPPDLANSEWTVFKVARNLETGAIFIDKESAVPSGPSIQTRMKWRGEDFQHDLVFANTRTGTILVLD